MPINFRLNADEVGYIVEHSGASVLLVDPELDEALAGVTAKRRFVIGAESDAELYRFGVEPEPWTPDEDATGTINYTSGTTARPKGVQLTHRNVWLNATTFGWQMGVSDRDVYLHTLPQFHCNGWGMVYAVTGHGRAATSCCARSTAPRSCAGSMPTASPCCAAPPPWWPMILDAAAAWDGPIPGRDRVRMVVAGAPPPTRTIERMETELGWEFVQIYGLTETAPLLTMNRGRAEFDDLSPADRAVKPEPGRRPGARRGARRSTRSARCWPAATS